MLGQQPTVTIKCLAHKITSNAPDMYCTLRDEEDITLSNGVTSVGRCFERKPFVKVEKI